VSIVTSLLYYKTSYYSILYVLYDSAKVNSILLKTDSGNNISVIEVDRADINGLNSCREEKEGTYELLKCYNGGGGGAEENVSEGFD
jgi:hypothetical protein